MRPQRQTRQQRLDARPSARSPAAWCQVVIACTLLTACTGNSLDWQRPEYGEPARPQYLQRYIDAHYQELGEEFVARLSLDRFEERLSNSRVLFLGDHHRDEVLHRNILWMLQWAADSGFEPVLGLEAIGVEDSDLVQDYLDGMVQMPELRSRMRERWPESWLEDENSVDAAFFRALLLLASDRRLPVFPLEPTPRLPLVKRDAFIARSVRAAASRWPKRLIVVIVGHAHLLGQGRLRARVGLPSLAVGARMPPRLTEAYLRYPRPPFQKCFLESSGGVLFLHPMSDMGLMRPVSPPRGG